MTGSRTPLQNKAKGKLLSQNAAQPVGNMVPVLAPSVLRLPLVLGTPCCEDPPVAKTPSLGPPNSMVPLGMGTGTLLGLAFLYLGSPNW